MKAYQLSALAAAFVAFGSAFAAPQVPHYGSKYPQHPMNMGYGNDYAKYWEGEAWVPPPAPAPAPQGEVFRPYPYSQSWTDGPGPVEERAGYEPPRYFPNSRSPARDAIAAHRPAAAASPQEQSVHEEPAPYAASGSIVRGGKNLKIGGDGANGDGTSFTKVLGGGSPEARSFQDGGVDGDSDWSAFSYGVVSDTLVVNDSPEEPHSDAAAPPQRKTHALGKIEKMMGEDKWHEKRAIDLDLEKGAGEGWPDHVKAKADRMMRAAAAMQERGAAKVAEDNEKNQKQAPGAPGAPGAPAPGQAAAPRPSGPGSDPSRGTGKKVPGKTPTDKKMAPAAAAAAAPPLDEPAKKPLPGKGQQKNMPSQAAPERVEDDDPLMQNDLPRGAGRTKKPKKPKSQRMPEPEAVAPEEPPRRTKPAQGGKDKAFQENSPKQGRTRKNPNPPSTVKTLVRRDDGALGPLRDITNIPRPDRVRAKKMGNRQSGPMMKDKAPKGDSKPKKENKMSTPKKKDSSKAPKKESKQTAPAKDSGRKDSGKNTGGISGRGNGKKRPNIDQDRPRKKSEKENNQDANQKPKKSINGSNKNNGPKKNGLGGGKKNKGKAPTLAKRDAVPASPAPTAASALDPVASYEACMAEYAATEKSLHARNYAAGPVTHRRVLPCGPPVTVRRIVGEDYAPTPLPVAAPMHQIAPVHAPIVAAPAIAAPVIAAPVIGPCGTSPCAPGDIRVQFAPVDVPFTPCTMTQTAYETVTQTQVVQTPGPVQLQYVDRPVEKIVEVLVAGPTQTVVGPVQTVFQTIVQTQTVVQTQTQVETVVQTQTQVLTQTRTEVLTETLVNHVTVTAPAVHHTAVEYVPTPVHYYHTETLIRSGPTQVVEKVAVPGETQVVREQTVRHDVPVATSVPVVKQVPISRTVMVCPACEGVEGHCDCGTFDGGRGGRGSGHGSSGSSDSVSVSKSNGRMDVDVDSDYTGGVPRTANQLENFFKARLPDEF